jgi:aconitate hydratase 2/2-methylisocitrate dehydratase
LNEIKEPLLACPNDPDDIKPLSAVQGTKIDEVFIGSCMTNIGHFRAASEVLKQVKGVIPTRLWIAPPTKMDQHQLVEEGVYSVFGVSGARTEMPGCSLCMGNQARVAPNSTVVSTSTRNFPNRLGEGANVFLASSELAAVSSVLGRIPTMEEYLVYMKNVDTMSGKIYRYLNFNEIKSYMEAAEHAKTIPLVNVREVAA